MSSLYEVVVIQRQESKIQISVQVIHPDSNYINDSPGFALMLLYHNVNNNFPIKKEVEYILRCGVDPRTGQPETIENFYKKYTMDPKTGMPVPKEN